jgi:hypothetical protein
MFYFNPRMVSPKSKKKKAGHKRRDIMRIKSLNSISRVLMVLIILSIIPSCAFASENNPTLGPAGKITEENFTDIQANILDSISKQITELQNFYANVSKASNASDLQEVLSSHMPANECMGRDGRGMRPRQMHMEHNGIGMNGLFGIYMVENVTDENFTAVQTEMLGSLQNMTDVIKDQQNHTEVGQDNNRTEELNNRITELQNLSTEVSKASNGAELKEVVFTHMQTQAVNSVDKKIEHLQAKVNERENTSGNTSDLSSRITELTTLKEKINGAESLEDLKTIMSSDYGIFGLREDMMHHGEHGVCGCRMDRQTRVNSTDSSTD